VGKIKKGYKKARYVVYQQTTLDPENHLWTFIGSFVGIGLIGYIQTKLHEFAAEEQLFLIGSFGASAVLVYGAAHSPLAQPRNLILGHLIGSFVGVSVFKILGGMEWLWISSALAVSLSIILMQVFKALHPPGGATALIAVIGSDKIAGLGYSYMLSPVMSGVLVLLVIGLIINNIPKHRSYPYNSDFTAIDGMLKKYPRRLLLSWHPKARTFYKNKNKKV
jgi:CBS-domain-containing membrane protein